MGKSCHSRKVKLFQLLSLKIQFMEEHLKVNLNIKEQILDVFHLPNQVVVVECCSFFSIIKLIPLHASQQSQLCLNLRVLHNVFRWVSMSFDVESNHIQVVGRFHDKCWWLSTKQMCKQYRSYILFLWAFVQLQLLHWLRVRKEGHHAILWICFPCSKWILRV